MAIGEYLLGPRVELGLDDERFPDVLRQIPDPPERLYVIGAVEALQSGIAIVGARKATPYGKSCAKHFATLAAERGIAVISGGARGCDIAAHQAALSVGGQTVVFLGGGCDNIYPAEHVGIFQRIVEGGGAIVSEYPWSYPPMRHGFRARNRLIAGLAKATLIVEAGLPSGTFSTADEALAAGREVLAVPGAITSKTSRGANRLIQQGAIPIVDDESFEQYLFTLFGALRQERIDEGGALGLSCERVARGDAAPLLSALRAEPLSMEELNRLAREYGDKADPLTWLVVWLAEAERDRLICRYPDGRYGALLVS